MNTIAPDPDRPGNMRYLMVALILLAAPLAGCADDGGTNSPQADGEGMLAEDGKAAADGEAQAWAEDARLVEIVTMELGPEAEQPDQGDVEMNLTPDDTPGDGVAAYWKYTYRNSDDEAMNVYVTAQGDTETSTEVETDSEREIGDWNVSSEEAAEKASEDENFTSLLEAEDATVLHGLLGGEEPAWLLSVESPSQDERRQLVVNAETGEMQPFPGSG
ncbi:hypothetical protein BRD56_03645 [Thermoplasmatales archaeon SW_10_69_26]|nr:MAG: hypothetical protein BRD56_03645 [Thermoplasmatales archaeon SW_10_69_26]